MSSMEEAQIGINRSYIEPTIQVIIMLIIIIINTIIIIIVIINIIIIIIMVIVVLFILLKLRDISQVTFTTVYKKALIVKYPRNMQTIKD